MVTYKSNSANAFLNLLNLKFLQCLTLTPSTRIPAQMLKANIITNAYIKPAVGVKYAKIGLDDVANIIRHCSQLKILSISSINKELRGGGKPPPVNYSTNAALFTITLPLFAVGLPLSVQLFNSIRAFVPHKYPYFEPFKDIQFTNLPKFSSFPDFSPET